MTAIGRFFKKEPLRLTVLYIPLHTVIYFGSQFFPHSYTEIYSPMDDRIPFVPFFVLFYLAWYFFMLLAMVYPLVTADRKLLWREASVTYLGMFICMAVCILFPTTFPGRVALQDIPFRQFFRFAISVIYSADKPINVFPSMHCFGAFASHMVMSGSELYRKHKWMHLVSALLVAGICLSTCLIKQHSVLDFLASLVVILLVSVPGFLFVPKYVKEGS